jgi:hypothetical protein
VSLPKPHPPTGPPPDVHKINKASMKQGFYHDYPYDDLEEDFPLDINDIGIAFDDSGESQM